MSKYRNLTLRLAEMDGAIWETNFSAVEEVLGFGLPASARQYQAWWANQMRSQSLGWQAAGWKTASVDLERERVTFIYVGGEDTDDGETQVNGLTISDAKLGLAATFGVKPDQVEIIIRA